MPVLNYATGVVSYGIFTGIMPANYGAGGITVTLFWTGDAAPASHNVVWAAAWERDDTTEDLTTDSFAANQTTTTAAPTLGQMQVTTITFTNGQIDGLLVNERYRFRVERTGTSGSDNFTGNAQLVGVLIKET